MYLLVTMLPFALLAPVVGPVLDHFRHGRRYALATTMLGRAFLAYMISEHVGGFTLYPAAFGILVLSRAYGVARSAAVPRVIPRGLGLSEAGARASVFGTLAGAIVAPIGLAAAAFGSAWPLRVSMLVFVFGMVTSLRLPPRADADPPEAVPRPLQRPGRKGTKVLSGRIVVASLVGSATLRAMYGFLALYLAFAIRGDTMPDRFLAWDLPQQTALGVVAGGLAVGSFLATAVGTRLRIHRPTQLQAGGIVLTGVAAIVAAIDPGLPSAMLLCLVMATASGLAKLAVDAVIQERIPEGVRASAFAHSETLLMVAWVSGGALGLVPFTARWGLVVVAMFAAVGAARAVAAAVLRDDRLRGTPRDESPAGDADQPADAATAGAATGATGATRAGATPRDPERLPAGDRGRRRWFGLRSAAPEPDPTLRLPADDEPAPQAPPQAGAGAPTGGTQARGEAPTLRLPGGDLPPQRTSDDTRPAARVTPFGETAGRPGPRQRPPVTRRITISPSEPVDAGAAADDRDVEDDLDETRINSPGFHLYRPSGLDGDDQR
jgi:hypothetical protein